eukprot:540908-Prorocentrum_minimum.AAC.1
MFRCCRRVIGVGSRVDPPPDPQNRQPDDGSRPEECIVYEVWVSACDTQGEAARKAEGEEKEECGLECQVQHDLYELRETLYRVKQIQDELEPPSDLTK